MGVHLTILLKSSFLVTCAFGQRLPGNKGASQVTDVRELGWGQHICTVVPGFS